MSNENLCRAKTEKNDEFYTQYEDIEAELNVYYEYDHDVFRGKTILCPCDDPEWSNFTKYFTDHFKRFGLRRLISTSYSKSGRGKILVMDRPGEKPVFQYLNGDGDFRSDEVSMLRDESDVIVTNPPFSLFKEFLAWIMGAEKQFAIMGNVNAITYKETFPLIKENRMWLGASIHSGGLKFTVPEDYPLEAAGRGIDENGKLFIRVNGVRWFTNLDHGQCHEPMQLMTMADNLKYNKKLKKKCEKEGWVDENGKPYYPKYDNYDAIDVPFTKCIPSDYDGVMGVPVTFLDMFAPQQFEIIGFNGSDFAEELGIRAIGEEWCQIYRSQGGTGHMSPSMHSLVLLTNGKAQTVYKRILIRRQKDA